ncbi:MAG TPA: TetR family transcriptional regulator [Dermatophilaceae bacterium]|jgi:TetR/AcrR family transcriptional regulator, regulator of biofilm formation and stress response
MASRTAKGSMRREQVLEAAGEILLHEGFRAMTHRRVAEAAGVPLGTTTYYFTDRGDLMRATVAMFLEREQVRRAGVRVSGSSLPATARALVDLLLPVEAGSARQQGAVIYERLGEALRDDDLRAVVSRDYADLESHVARILRAMDPAPDPGLVLALAEGRLLQWLASDRRLNTLVAAVATDLATLTSVTPARPPGSA